MFREIIKRIYYGDNTTDKWYCPKCNTNYTPKELEEIKLFLPYKCPICWTELLFRRS